MTLRRTVDLLPEIFRTETNKKFLSATLDQLIQEPSLKRTQGYVGRRIGPGVNPADNYVVEPTASRTDYQLEPGIVFLEPDTETPQDAITYPGIIDTLQLFGSNVSRQDRLFESQYYSWDPLCDLDKFSNYSQYYWLPDGPASVDVSATDVPLSDIYTVTRSEISYTFSGVPGSNPIITLARGGNHVKNAPRDLPAALPQPPDGAPGMERRVGSAKLAGVSPLGAKNQRSFSPATPTTIRPPD
jgi:hypothetical protein